MPTFYRLSGLISTYIIGGWLSAGPTSVWQLTCPIDNIDDLVDYKAENDNLTVRQNLRHFNYCVAEINSAKPCISCQPKPIRNSY